MQISITIITMRTILLVNTFKYIFLSIRLLLPSSTSVSTSLKEVANDSIFSAFSLHLFLVLSRVSL